MIDTRLIVNADDLGMSRGITDGIVLAHRYGFLTSASLMPNMPAAEYAVGRLANSPRLGVGIHLNICQGKPLLPARDVPSLVAANGCFHSPADMIRRLWTWQVSSREIEAEFRAQIQWVKNYGISATHADSHHHLHIYPAATLPFVRALSAEGISCTRAPRCSVWTSDRAADAPVMRRLGGPHEGSAPRRLLVQAYRGGLQGFFALRHLSMPSSRISFHSNHRRNLAALGAAWKDTFLNLPAGTYEFACHPGLFERGFSESDRLHLQREEELHWLTSTECLDAIERSGTQLITYRSLSEHRPVSAIGEVTALQ